MYHLIHPALVHFAVALLITGAATEGYGVLRRRAAAERFGNVLVIAGTLALLPTIVSGYLAANTLSVTPAARDVLAAHERNGLILLAVFLVALVWRGWSGGRIAEDQRWFYGLWLIAGVVVAAYSAFLGGELVYGYGVGVLPGR